MTDKDQTISKLLYDQLVDHCDEIRFLTVQLRAKKAKFDDYNAALFGDFYMRGFVKHCLELDNFEYPTAEKIRETCLAFLKDGSSTNANILRERLANRMSYEDFADLLMSAYVKTSRFHSEFIEFDLSYMSSYMPPILNSLFGFPTTDTSVGDSHELDHKLNEEIPSLTTEENACIRDLSHLEDIIY